jgi:putative zinc finger/helix-turn-helix YgiT family protein
MMCDRCGFQALSEEQSNAYTMKSADAYRRRHKLLTSKALKAIRRLLGLSQQCFAAFLKVGVASVKRWETGLVQDASHDQLIRLRTDLTLAKRNVQDIEARSKGVAR